MDKEKILYLAKHNGGFSIRTLEYVGLMMDNIDYLITNKMLVWLTRELWDSYVGSEQQDLYEQAFHEYKITPRGEVLLALYRLGYAHKNHQGEEKHLRRIEEVYSLLERCDCGIEEFRKHLTKNQKKALDYAVLIHDLPNICEAIIEPELVDESKLNPWKIKHRHLGIPQERMEAINLDEPILTSMFNMSDGLGTVGINNTRTADYVLRKINEELGELTLEMNIADGLSYKKAGKDGVKGEAVDLAICSMDMFALQCPGMSPEEIEREFLAYMLVKLNKWRDTLK